MSKVMLVDDDHNTVRLLQMLLEMDGFEVVIAPSGEAALSKVVETKPDAFLVDYHLSDTAGTEFVRQLRDRPEFAASPIIMTSGLDHSDEAMAAGATEFLIKPFEPNDLSAKLHSLLGMG